MTINFKFGNDKTSLNIDMTSTLTLWQVAAKAVDIKYEQELRDVFDLSCGPHAILSAVQQKRDQCNEKRWSCTNLRGQKVYIRDILERVVFWLDKVRSIGDVISSFDPVHAALPWAGVRFLLEAATSDIKQQYDLTLYLSSFFLSRTLHSTRSLFKDSGVMMESLEVIVGIISRYAIIEQMYCLRYTTEAQNEMRAGIVRLYTAVLVFLCKAHRYFAQNIAKRVLSSFTQLGKQSEDLTQEVMIQEAELQKWTSLVDKEIQIDSNSQVGTKLEELKDTFKQFATPLTNIELAMEYVQDGLQRDERMKIMRWISSELYISHHKTIASNRLKGSGLWLLEDETYKQWKSTVRHPFLWLKGDAGTGKTQLTSMIIDDIEVELATQNDVRYSLAYFYCSRDSSEPRRADCSEILLSILKQLACSGGADEPIAPQIVSKWQEYLRRGSDDRLDRDECIDMITSICARGGVFIIIDALDECSKESRQDLLESLKTINENSDRIVRIFASSRPLVDIKIRLYKTPCLEILAKSNSGDIANYVNSELAKKIKAGKFLGGKPSENIVTAVKKKLIQDADGNFRWVAASIQTLCARNHEIDVIRQLGRIPNGLNDVYAIIMQQIREGNTVTGELAENLLRWLLCAQLSLPTDDVIATITNDSNLDLGTEIISTDYILDICCNFVKYDREQNIFRFVHLSVREYLETSEEAFDDSRNHAYIASVCLRNQFIGERPWPKVMAKTNIEKRCFYDYALVYWPFHCELAKEHRLSSTLSNMLIRFLSNKKTGSNTFSGFLEDWYYSWLSLGLPRSIAIDTHVKILKRIEECKNLDYDPIFLICAFGFIEILQDEKNYSQECLAKTNVLGRNPFHAAISQNQKEIVDFLILKRYYSFEEKDDGPLILAVSENQIEMATKILNESPGTRISTHVIEAAVESASINVFELLVNHEECDEFEVTNLLVLKATKNTVDGARILEALLRRNMFLEIEGRAIEDACSNPNFSVEMLKSLLDRKSNYVTNHEAALYAASNGISALDLLKILFGRNANLGVDDALICAAASNTSLEPIKFLIGHTKVFKATYKSITVACSNNKSGSRMLELILDLDPTALRLIDGRVIKVAIKNNKFNTALVSMILERTSREKLPITHDILWEAAPEKAGELLLSLLLPVCPMIKIPPALVTLVIRSGYSPAKMLNLLLSHDSSIELKVETCIQAVYNDQHAIDLLHCIEARIPDRLLIQHPSVIEKMPLNRAHGFELVKRFWVNINQGVSGRALEAAVRNKEFGEKILMHWCNIRCPIQVTPRAVELAVESPMAVQLLKILMKLDTKLKFSAQAMANAAAHSSKAIILLKVMFKHQDKIETENCDELFSAAIFNYSNSDDIIKFLYESNNFHSSKFFIEAMSMRFGDKYKACLFLLKIAPPSHFTEEAFEYALYSTSNLVQKLDSILTKNNSLKLSPAAWAKLYGGQSNIDTLITTIHTLSKHNIAPTFSELGLKALVNRHLQSKLILPLIRRYIMEFKESSPVSTEILHACIQYWTPDSKPMLELLLDSFTRYSRNIQLRPQLWSCILAHEYAETLLSTLEKFSIAVPETLEQEQMEYALVNLNLKDGTIEHRFQISSRKRDSVCRQKENLNKLLEVNAINGTLQDPVTSVIESPSITPEILMAVIDLAPQPIEWIKFAAVKDPSGFPFLITREVIEKIVGSKQELVIIEELAALSLQIGFQIPVSSDVLERCYLETFCILFDHVRHSITLDDLFLLLTPKILAHLSTFLEGFDVLESMVFPVLGEDKIRTLYSEQMLMAAAGSGILSWNESVYEHIEDPKPKDYYLDIAKLYISNITNDILKVRKLLNRGVYPNAKDEEGCTFIAKACMRDYVCIVRLAVQYPEVDCNTKDLRGRTPLMLAAERGYYEIVEALLKRGVETHHKRLDDNMTAEEVALFNGHYGLADMIKNHQTISPAQQG